MADCTRKSRKGERYGGEGGEVGVNKCDAHQFGGHTLAEELVVIAHKLHNSVYARAAFVHDGSEG